MSTADSSDAPARDFEQVFTELEEHVRRLEQGDLPLEEALALYEAGVRLQRECQELLDSAEQRILELTDGPEGPVLSAPDGSA